MIKLIIKAARYLWPSPYTVFGLVMGAMLLATGGSVRRRDGTLGFCGGRFLDWLDKFLPIEGFVAVTYGHVILARTEKWLEFTHSHEMVHVRQFERWGVAMGPAYITASVVAWCRGKRFYRDNIFEIEAYNNE